MPWEEVQEQVGLLTYFGPCPVGLHGSAIGNGTPGLAPNSPLPPIEWTCEDCPPTPAEARGQAAPATPVSEGGRTAVVSPEQDVLHWSAEQTDDWYYYREFEESAEEPVESAEQTDDW